MLFTWWKSVLLLQWFIYRCTKCTGLCFKDLYLKPTQRKCLSESLSWFGIVYYSFLWFVFKRLIAISQQVHQLIPKISILNQHNGNVWDNLGFSNTQNLKKDMFTWWKCLDLSLGLFIYHLFDLLCIAHCYKPSNSPIYA